MLRRIGTSMMKPVASLRHGLHSLWKLQHRERRRLWVEMQEMQDLMPLLMKQRDGYRWSDADRREIRRHLRKLASLSPYLVLFVSPGGFLALPVLAWWLDQRRQKRLGKNSDPATTIES